MTDFIQRSFAGGEVAPALFGRADQVKYQTGLRTCRNFFVRRHGGVSNRAGSQFIGEQKNSAARGRLLKFVFNAQQTYILLFENLTIRFYNLGVLLTVSNVTAWNSGTNYNVGDLASLGGINYYCILAHTNQSPPNATYWYAMPGTIFEVPTPYVTADLPTLYIVQSGDVISIDHNNYAPMKLSRLGATQWTLLPDVIGPTQQPPTNVAVAGTAGIQTLAYAVTAIAIETFEESVAATGTTGSLTPAAPGTPITITWTAAANAQQYNIYMVLNGLPSFVGSAIGTSFKDTGFIPNQTQTPPQVRNPFSGAGNFPGVVSYFDQRRIHANTINKPETTWASKSGQFPNFSVSSPLQDNDAVTFTIAGRQVNAIRHIVDIGNMVILTAGGEWIAFGDASGTLIPSAPGLKQVGYHGASPVPPCIIGINLVYVQARGNLVRDFRRVISQVGAQGFTGDDLTVFAPHLLEGFTIDRWDFAQIPHSIVWAVRSDGVLLGLTYLAEQEISGWHRHDTNGIYEDVCVVPEGNEDFIYVLVNRTIQGVTRRYLERFSSRRVTDVTIDAHFMDCYLTYDGRNTTATTMNLLVPTAATPSNLLTMLPDGTLQITIGPFPNETFYLQSTSGQWWRIDTNATTGIQTVTSSGAPSPGLQIGCLLQSGDGQFWQFGVLNTGELTILAVPADSLILTASAAPVPAPNVGDAIVLNLITAVMYGESGIVTAQLGDTVRLAIIKINAPTIFIVTPNKTVPASLANVALTTWGRAAFQFSGIDQLNGQALAILADGVVVTNGFDPPFTTVVNGQFTLLHPAVVVHAGLPYASDFELLDLEVLGGETIFPKLKKVTNLTLMVEASRGVWAGPDADHLMERKPPSILANTAIGLTTGKLEMNIQDTWNSSGRIFVRQRDPIPLTILSVMPNGELGG
jgi:hypothetical protein